MSYSDDLKTRVLSFVRGGGSKVEAAERFKVARSTIYLWLAQPTYYVARKPGPKTSYKFKREALLECLQDKPESSQKDLAARFAVSTNAISHALKRMGVVRKKKQMPKHDSTVFFSREQKK